MTAREWSFRFEPPADWVTPNDRTQHRWDRNRPQWRATSATLAQRHKLPKGLTRARIDIVIAPPHEKHDRSAFSLTCKAIVDGLGPPFFRKPSGKSKGAAAPGYGLISNDGRKRLDGEHLHLIDPAPPRGRIAVYVVDLAEVPSGRTWTPTIETAKGRRVRTKRACNGCGVLLGDVTDDEIASAIAGLPLPDVRSECLNCKEEAHA